MFDKFDNAQIILKNPPLMPKIKEYENIVKRIDIVDASIVYFIVNIIIITKHCPL